MKGSSARVAKERICARSVDNATSRDPAQIAQFRLAEEDPGLHIPLGRVVVAERVVELSQASTSWID